MFGLTSGCSVSRLLGLSAKTVMAKIQDGVALGNGERDHNHRLIQTLPLGESGHIRRNAASGRACSSTDRSSVHSPKDCGLGSLWTHPNGRASGRPLFCGSAQ
jgi:hypothetical protein